MAMNIAEIHGIDIVIKSMEPYEKYRLIIVCLLILLFLLLLNLYRNRKPIIETFSMDSTTKEEITDELVIVLFIEDIIKQLRGSIRNIIREKLWFIIMK